MRPEDVDAIKAQLKEVQKMFAQGVGVAWPWMVSKVEMVGRELEVHVDLDRSVTALPCPKCEAVSPIYDRTATRRWRTLDYYMFKSFLVGRPARVRCVEHGVRRADVPWAQAGSHFNYHFQALVMSKAQNTPMAVVARELREHDTRLWRIVTHHVKDGLGRLDLSAVRRIGVDDKSYQVGHKYLTVVADLDTARVIFVTEGRDGETLGRFRQFLIEHGGDPKAITQISQDMSQAYASGAKQYFPDATVVFDHFHVIKLMGETVDKVRREEQREQDILRGTRYIWLKNAKNLTDKQLQSLTDLSRLNLRTVRAFKARLDLQDIYLEIDAAVADKRLRRWYYRATHSRLEPLKNFAYTVADHWAGILAFFESRTTNGLLEGLNSLIQATKAKARGYRTINALKSIVYLIGSSLLFNLPTLYSE